MLEVLTFEVLKAVTSTCVKFYLSSLLGASGTITYDKAELGYKVPKWFMNPDSAATVLYSYGTSIQGDEFQSIDDARNLAIDQMAKTVRTSTRAMVEKEIRYDRSSPQQRRLVEILVKGDGLEDFIRANTTITRKQLVEVTKPEKDMRAFVELQLDAKVYGKFRTETLQAAKKRILAMKTDDLLAELEADETAPSTTPPGADAQPPPPVKPQAGTATTPEKEPDSVPERPAGSAPLKGAGFRDLEKELESETQR